MSVKISDMDRVKSDLYLFYQYTVASNFTKRLSVPHIRKLSRYLMAQYTGKIDKRVSISLPPQHSKTSLVSDAFIPWLITRDPKLRIMLITKGQKFADKLGDRIRSRFMVYKDLIGVELSKSMNTKANFAFVYPKGYKDPKTGEDKGGQPTGGEVIITSRGSANVTGNPVDYMVIDDPYEGRDEDLTPTALQGVVDWFNGVAEQRILPHTKFVILHTRWNSQDLIGYFMETQPEDFIFLNYPAYDFKTREVLWSEFGYTYDFFAKKMSKMGEPHFNAVYMGIPVDESGDFFNINRIRWGRPKGIGEYLAMECRSWDLSSKDGLKNDFTAGVPVYRTNFDNILITDYVYGKFGEKDVPKQKIDSRGMPFDDWNDLAKKGTPTVVKETAKNDGVAKLQCIELPGFGGDFLYEDWKKELEGLRVHHSDHGNMPKPDRATPLKNKMNAGKVYVEILNPKLRDIFIKEFTKFPNGQHDDIVDACSHGVNYLFDFFNQRRTGTEVAVFA